MASVRVIDFWVSPSMVSPATSFVSFTIAVALLAVAGPAGAQTVVTPVPGAAGTPGPAASTLVHVTSCGTRHAGAGAEAQYVAPGPVAGQASNSSFENVYGDDYYQPLPGTSSPLMIVGFTNISGKPMTMIEFGLLSNEILAGEARDTGTFTPGAGIKAKLGISLTAILPGPTKCVPLRITFADGSTWRNPRLPPRGNAYFNSKYPPKPL